MRVRTHAAVLIGISVGACSPTGSQDNRQEMSVSDDHFTCSAMISAADRLISTGRLASNETVARDGLLTAMGHMNAWAVPKSLPEKQAFDQAKAERDRLISSLPPNEILTRALTCIEQAKAAKGS
jgi:hypothetical protein